MSGKINSYNLKSLIIELIHSSPSSKFKCCWEVFKLTFILSHVQASTERAFSIYKELLTENLEEVSTVSQKIVYNHICDLSMTYVPFSNDLLKSSKRSPLDTPVHWNSKNLTKSRMRKTEKEGLKWTK